jgi:hypothetical protein
VPEKVPDTFDGHLRGLNVLRRDEAVRRVPDTFDGHLRTFEA